MAGFFRNAPRDVRSFVLAVAAIGFGSSFAGGQAVAAASGAFLAHQALYELNLVKSRGSNSINGARGRILYNFSGSACEGYTSEFRQVSELDSGEGKVTLSDLRSTTWEDGAAKKFIFKSQNYLNEALIDSVDGQADRQPGGVAVNLTKPSDKKFDLEAAIAFPTDHMRRIIEATREGKSILEIPIYDGSDKGEKVPFDVKRRDEIADAVAGHGELLRPRRQSQGRRADAGLRDVVRALRERCLAGAGARLQ